MSIVPVVILTKEEARACVDRIQAGIDGIRAEVLRLHEGEGWRALGYESWRECVTAEFGQSRSRFYQLLDAAQIERALSATVTNNASPDATLSTMVESVAIPERVLRPLKPLLNDPEALRETWAAAKEEYGPEPTAAQVRAKVDEKLPFNADRPNLATTDPTAYRALRKEMREEREREEAEAAEQQKMVVERADPRGIFARNDTRDAYREHLGVVRSFVAVDPETLLPALNDADRTYIEAFLPSIRKWCDDVEAALRPGPRRMRG